MGQPSHVGRCPTVGVDHNPWRLSVDAPPLPGGLHPPRLLIRFGFRPGGGHHLQRMEPEGTVPAAFGGAVLLLPLLRVRALADVAAPVVEQQGVKGAGQCVILLAASEVVAVGHGLSVSKTTHSRIDQNLELASLLRRVRDAYRHSCKHLATNKGPEGPLPRHDHLLFAADIRYQPMAQAAPMAVSCPLRETPIEKADGDPRGVVTSRV